jgi:hypothetical protein
MVSRGSPERDRGTPPPLPKGLPIDSYSSLDIADVVRWVISDGQLRTDAEIIDEVAKQLGFSQRGKNIVRAIQLTILRLRAKGLV